MQWVTRERPKIDRVACPWLIRRFLDPVAEFLFVPPSEVPAVAARTGAIPYDIDGVELSPDGPLCSELAVIVRAADTARLDLAPQAAGLLAISLDLSHNFHDDQEQLRRGFVLYDALYAWCKDVRGRTHTWNPQRAPAGAVG